MDRLTKVVIILAVLLAIPLAIGVYKRYAPSMRSSLGLTQESGERESIRQYIDDQFFERVRTYDDITTTELRAQQAKGVISTSVNLSAQESAGVRYYTVNATLTHKGSVRGTAYGTVTAEPPQSGPSMLHYDVRFDYVN